MIKKIFFLLVLLTSSLVFAIDGQTPWTVQNFRSQNGEMFFAVAFDVPDGQGLYWRNPGDSGSAPKINFYSKSKKLELKEMPWKVPSRKVVTKKLWTYNLNGKVVIFYKVPGKVQDQIYDQDVTVEARWLVCAGICVPGSGTISGHYIYEKYNSYTSPSFVLEDDWLEKELSQRPAQKNLPTDFEFQLGKWGAEDHILFYSTSVKNDPKYKLTNLLYPHPHSSVNFAHEKLMHDKAGNIYGSVVIDGEVKLPLTIKFLADLGNEYRVSDVTIKSLTPNLSENIKKYRQMFTPIDPTVKMSKEIEVTLEDSTSVWYFLLFAFIGGLILNVMPCVLPVISIKLFGLIKINGASHREILGHNLLYTAGILLSFVVLAAVVIILRTAGESVGWGFQMQSPRFVLFMILGLLIFALNMFGIFEFRTPGGKFLGNISVSNHHLGSFLSGILATVLSTPCSAPFLGTALTFAFTTSNTFLFATLMMIGLGLAFPILLTGIFPKLINFLPRPGNWMNHLKKFLGLSLLLTAVWLASVFYSLTSNPLMPGPFYNLGIISGLILLAFYLYRFRKFVGLSFGIAAIVMTAYTYNMQNVEFPNILVHEPIAGSAWVSWSPDKLETYKGERPVFIKFTADWCITCKVDTRLIIKSSGFTELVEKHDLALVVGDYTAPQPKMDRWMKAHGLVGVPAYLIQYKDGTRKRIDGQLTLKKLDELLSR
ncbi:MAG: hypothetical protein KAG61_02745 [Bacteriovoracaceae bacterium]|nr:hypothetical protein [Bacteriovoracaceae bacterium]